MCGIYGAFGPQLADGCAGEILTAMGNVIYHRGPDDHGEYTNHQVALGMRRLSIIDLEGGHQPIANEDKTVWVVCNGEIYNFRELRTELEARGHVFRTKSDTEVLVHLYEQEGLALFKRLRGMFAVALWDEKESKLILGRDRVGKKPLYLSRDAGRLLFASEIKSILEVSQSARRINLQALREYLALGYVPAPLTLLDGIEKLLPGFYAVIDDGGVRYQQYWDVPFETEKDVSESAWVERVREKFLEAVRIRLISDVPLGAFLSGGIDSSAIVAAMSHLTDRPVKTYSIGFEGPDNFYNELPYARVVAKAFGTDHHEIIVRPEIAELLPSLIWHLDEPIADSAFVTTNLVARLASQSVKVILSGVGGDELFGGYRRYLGDNIASYYRMLPGAIRKKWLPSLIAALPQDRHSSIKNYLRYADAFLKTAEADSPSRYMSYVTLFSNDLQNRLLDGWVDGTAAAHRNGVASDIMAKYFEDGNTVDDLNRLIYVDMKTSLPDDLLALTDKMTMAASIECRAPFMDHELVELASVMPASFKVHGLTMKYLLKKVVTPWLPKEIINRKKRGFGAPMGAWFRNDLGPLVRNLLSEAQIKQRGFFNWQAIEEIIGRHMAQKNDYTDQLLALVNLELWCRIFLDGADYRDNAVMMRGE
jgi:asparagine synthase (glutamine-hydrolysing)